MALGILIDPARQSVTPVEFRPGDIGAMRDLIGCDTITAAYIEQEATIYLDDEGLAQPELSFFYHISSKQPLVGRGLVVGTDENGRSIDCPFTVEQIEKQIDFGTPMRAGSALLFVGGKDVYPIS